MSLQLAYERTLDCVHCGLCLPVCPTYETSGLETDSPRGRILIMRALAEGRLNNESEGLHPPLDRCLACRACETACPSGVRYGEILEETRTYFDRTESKGSKRFVRFLLDRALAHRGGHQLAMDGLSLLQKSGVTWLLQKLPIPAWSKKSFELLPSLPPKSEREPIRPGIYEPYGERRAEVGLFTGCMMETVFGRVNRAVLEVLRHYGCRVHVPRDQGCCGALHLHAGFRDAARPLVERNLAAFPQSLDAIVVDSAGCGSSMKEYGHWMPEAGAFAAQVRDFSEWLVELGPRPAPQPVRRRVTYDDPCHLCHAQGIVSQPRQILATIPELEVVPLPHADDCCGSAGIYNLVQREMSDAVLDRKMEQIRKVNVDTVLTANPGCHLQLAMGARRKGLDLQVLHLAELLVQAWSPTPSTHP
jgi:glycolate oxidase iron-sulfur subunit